MIDAVELTKKLVRIESTDPGTFEQEVASCIVDLLKDSGAEVIRDDVAEGRTNIIATIYPQMMSRQGMLILTGHMDTVVVGSGWTKDPFGAEEAVLAGEDVIYGRGSCDMKSGLACALTAFLHTAEAVKNGSLVLSRPLRLICTVDEEADMIGIEHAIRNGYVKKEDLVLDLEPTDGMIQNAHKGRFWIEVTVNGVTAHASQPEKGADAILAAAKMIAWMKEQISNLPKHPDMGPSTITFGQIEGGYQPYVVPDRCRFTVDIRLVQPASSEMIVAGVEEYIRKVSAEQAKLRIEYKITGDRPPIEANEESVLLRMLSEAVTDVTGEEPLVRPFTGYTDTAVAAGLLGNRECMSYGPGNLALAHKPDEYVKIGDIHRCFRVMQRLIMKICM